VVQTALDGKYSGDMPPWIRKLTPDKVEFEHDDKFLASRYSLSNGQAELGADYEVELTFTPKRPK